MAKTATVITPFGDHRVGETLVGADADAALAGPNAGHFVRGPDAPDPVVAIDAHIATPVGE